MLWRMADNRYHHGDLRRQVLRETAAVIAEHGVDAVSLRDIARRCGVSHAAPAHHFTDRTGLLTALATEGFRLLADALAAPARGRPARSELVDMGVRYVRFALRHPAHFRVMYDAKLLHANDSELLAARAETAALLRGGIAGLPAGVGARNQSTSALAAWSLAHGYATLQLGGNLPASADPAEAFRRLTSLMFTST